jgi:hypothetical protein
MITISPNTIMQQALFLDLEVLIFATYMTFKLFYIYSFAFFTLSKANSIF